jgi:hypothetical protein
MPQLMEAELTRRIGAKQANIAGREANWHGTTTGSAVMGDGRSERSVPGGAGPTEKRALDTGRCSLRWTC